MHVLKMDCMLVYNVLMSTMKQNSIRPTKKQQELLLYIQSFIQEHGYSPSYREIMNGCNYTSVATVSLHVTSLIRRGHLRKRDRSARSLEVVDESQDTASDNENGQNDVAGENWLVAKVESFIERAEQGESIKEAEALITALEVIGLHTHAQLFQERIAQKM